MEFRRLTDVSEVPTASVLMDMHHHRHPDGRGKDTIETSVNFYDTTRHNIPEDGHLKRASP
jgi:hypothetical protein